MKAAQDSMQPNELVTRLRAALPDLRTRFGVRNLSLFGSRARGDARSDSDVDLLVDFDDVPGFFKFVELEDELARLLGMRVDLVMATALRPAIGRRILAEAVAV